MSILPFIHKLQVLDKVSNLVIPFTPNQVQADYLSALDSAVKDRVPFRAIVLKARQMGISTATEAAGFVMTTLVPNFSGLIVGSDHDNSEHILGMTRRFWETNPFQALFTPKYLSRKEIEWTENKSGLRVATSNNVQTGRGKTLRFLHGSEVAFWADPDTLMTGLRQTVPTAPRTFIILESTANGIGNYFHTTWENAEAGDNEYQPFFYPWFDQNEYCAESIGLTVTHPFVFLDEEERVLAKTFDTITPSKLTWRRWAIRNLCGNDINKFHQEYPSTPEEAFISTGTNIFPLDQLKEIYDPKIGQIGRFIGDRDHPKFLAEATGPLKIFRNPSKDRGWGKYVVAGDPTHTTHGDYAVAQVLNRHNFEQVAVLRRKIDPLSFADDLYRLGKFYNDALLVTETEGPGYGTIGRLIEMNYPNLWKDRSANTDPGKINNKFGWSTNYRTKEWAIGHMIKSMVDKQMVIHDRTTYAECKTYVRLTNGEYGPADGKNGHDDTVMAFGIGMVASITEGPLPAHAGPPKIQSTAAWEQWNETNESGVA